MEQDQQFVEYVLKAVVDNPDDVQVERTIDEMGVLISVTVNPEDMGKVIGKSGQTAKAIRTLLKVVGAKNDARVNMKIIEPEGGKGPGKRDDGAASVAPPTGTDAVDDAAAAPLSPADDPAAVNEAEQIQQQTDAATIPSLDDDNSRVDEATGKTREDEPNSVAAVSPSDDLGKVSDNATPTKPQRDPLHEPSPLDDL